MNWFIRKHTVAIHWWFGEDFSPSRSIVVFEKLPARLGDKETVQAVLKYEKGRLNWHITAIEVEGRIIYTRERQDIVTLPLEVNTKEEMKLGKLAERFSLADAIG